MKGIYLFIIFLFLHPDLFSQFDKPCRRRINNTQPISPGEEVYNIVKDGVVFVYPESLYCLEKITYIYKGRDKQGIKILYKYEYTDEAISPAKKLKVKEIVLPLDPQGQALLETEDNRKIYITLTENGAIEVEEGD
ncbi:MAG: hypothetical protein DRP61_04595 [Candidatus Omnitrophota bacterium]|nr:MAG: hypothetical protein DRP61_04595 [Candidatus Omnitrophota bacterium]